MSINVNITDNTGQIVAQIARAARGGLGDAGEHLLAKANETIPLEEGTMAGSGTVVSEGDETAVGYTADDPKVIRQHEDLTLRHAPGRRAKWLESAGNEQADRILHFLAQRLEVS